MIKVYTILLLLFQTEERRNKRRKDKSEEFKKFQGKLELLKVGIRNKCIFFINTVHYFEYQY